MNDKNGGRETAYDDFGEDTIILSFDVNGRLVGLL